MRFSEEQIKEIASLRESLNEQIDDHKKSISMLETNLKILDMALKESSFTKASHLRSMPRTADAPARDSDAQAPEAPRVAAPDRPKGGSIPIRQGGSGKILADAYVTHDEIRIVLNDTRIGEDVPPFRSFFLDRIVGDMTRKDQSEVDAGRLEASDMIECTVNSNDTGIQDIVIKRYRHKERADEIIRTIEWSLTRMLEKVPR